VSSGDVAGPLKVSLGSSRRRPNLDETASAILLSRLQKIGLVSPSFIALRRGSYLVVVGQCKPCATVRDRDPARSQFAGNRARQIGILYCDLPADASCGHLLSNPRRYAIVIAFATSSTRG